MKKNFSTSLHLKKQQFYERRLKDTSNISKEIWTIVNSNTGKVKHNTTISHITNNNVIISDPVEIGNIFCSYFAEVAIKSLNDVYNDFDGNCSTGLESLSSIFFYDITLVEIENTLTAMQNKSSSGPAGIPIKC